MHLGVTIPQREIPLDVPALRDFAQAAESMGYDHVMTGDHVLGASVANRPDWRGPYTNEDLWHEPFVLFGYLAGLTNTIELVSSILVLPQRQTALVAKQAAQVDVLSGGRMRLGIGVGWNHVEFEALGESFTNRGRRSEEQMEVMHALWTQEVVTYEGRWHKIDAAGLNPMPVQRPIPIWIGGGPNSVLNAESVESDPVLRRIARRADGWFPSIGPVEECAIAIETLHGYMREYGRDPSEVGIQGRVAYPGDGPEGWLREARAWLTAGATHITARTVGAGLATVDEHIEAMAQVREALDDLF